MIITQETQMNAQQAIYFIWSLTQTYLDEYLETHLVIDFIVLAIRMKLMDFVFP